MNIMNTLKNVNVLHIVKFMSKLKKLIMMANASSDDLYSNKYLTIQALEDNLTVSFINNLEYCIDGNLEWQILSANRPSPSINLGQSISFRANRSTAGGSFSISKRCSLSGNVMSLLYGDDAEGSQITSTNRNAFGSLFKDCTTIVDASRLRLPSTTLAPNCYAFMFQGCSSLTSAPALPATTLADNCYSNMFRDCTSLTTAPELPVTTLAPSCYALMFQGCSSLTSAPDLPATKLVSNCYSYMFQGCTSLTTAPALPAITLTTRCYDNMFYGCTSLVTAPALPATTLATYCYSNMFNGCTSLTTAPDLPATILANNCYQYMFRSCISLTTAPELPATELVSNCYSNMFYGCSNLNYIKALFLTEPSTYTRNWIIGVAINGIFVKNNNATWNVIGANGIPNSWNVIEYPCVSPTIINSNDEVTFYYNDGLYTPKKNPISLLSIFDYNQMMQLKPECNIEVCILSKGSLVESLYEWKHDMSLNDVIDDLNLYYEDITIVINKVIIESNDAGYYGYYY